jgi:hypothetical protein
MKSSSPRWVLTLLVLIVASATGFTQTKKPDPFSTTPKLVVTKLKRGDADLAEVRGKASFTILAANSDDTMSGTMTYAIPDDARKEIAKQANKSLNDVPATLTQNDVVANFQKATACPAVHLEFSPMDIKVAGLDLHFNRYVVDVNESAAKIPTLICVWTRQINNGKARRGVIREMNDYINGENSREGN